MKILNKHRKTYSTLILIKMNILITLCARGGSKGIPGKNIKELAGIPLIAYSIKTAKKFASKFKNVIIELSTDSEQIKGIANQYGLNSEYTRPEKLASDEVGKIDAIKDILEYSEGINNCRFDYILDLDVTSPLRTLDDLLLAFDLIKNNDPALNLFSVSKADRSPYFNMVEKKENGYYTLVKKSKTHVLTRQSAPNVFSMNASFYFYKRAFFDADLKSAITDFSLIYEMPHICFDLDEPIDFEFISYLILNNKLTFEL